MEGYVKYWEGYMGLGSWNKIYLVLSHSQILMCKKRGGNIQGKISLEVSTIK